MLQITNGPTPGVLTCRLNLAELYPDQQDRAAFEDRWKSFYDSDEEHHGIYSRAEIDVLEYRSESLIPELTDARPPLLLLLGNPASHSVAAGMCFAYEGDQREHRFWVALRETGLLVFNKTAANEVLTSNERNQRRKQQLFDLDYSSPFRIGITMYYTMPSPASGSPWSGVSGLHRLFGKQAIDRIAAAEQERIAQIVQAFMPRGGGMLVFQRDAYEGMRCITDTPYALDLAMAGQLNSHYRCSPNVHVVGVPPTRFMLSSSVRETLERTMSLHADR